METREERIAEFKRNVAQIKEKLNSMSDDNEGCISRLEDIALEDVSDHTRINKSTEKSPRKKPTETKNEAKEWFVFEKKNRELLREYCALNRVQDSEAFLELNPHLLCTTSTEVIVGDFILNSRGEVPKNVLRQIYLLKLILNYYDISEYTEEYQKILMIRQFFIVHGNIEVMLESPEELQVIRDSILDGRKMIADEQRE